MSESKSFINDQKFAKALLESEENFKLIAESFPAIVWTATKEGAIDYYNSRWTDFTGFTSEETLGWAWKEAIHPDDIENTLAVWNKCVQNGTHYKVEFRVKAWDGRYHWMLVTGRPLRNQNGEIVKWVGTSIDVQDEKQTEDELKEKNKELSIINRLSKLLVAELNLEKIVQAVTDAGTDISNAQFGAFFYNVINEKGEAYTLYTISGVPKEAFSKFPMPRNTQVFAPTFEGKGIMRSDDITQDPRYGKNKPYNGMPEGHLPVKSYLALPVISSKGGVIGGLFFGHEKSGVFNERIEQAMESIASHAAVAIDNARMFEEIRSGEKKFKFMAESIPQLVWTTDAEGKVDFINNNWLEYTGQTWEQARDHGWAEALHPNDMQPIVDLFIECVKTGEPFNAHYRLKGKGGRYRWFLSRGVPMKDDNGKVVKWFGTCTDINEQKNMAEQLEKNVEQRTKQLRLLNEELVRSNNDLQQFASVASHDLKEPLRKVSIFSDMLRGELTNIDAHQQELLNKIQSSSLRMQRLVDDLLSFSRLTASASRNEKVDLGMILRRVVDDYEITIKEKNAIITIPELPVIEGAPTQLQQLFQNIISNALKFSRKEVQPEIRISVEVVSGNELLSLTDQLLPDEEYCRIEIKDNGIGFDEKYLEKVFVIFQRLHSKDEYQGSGIGLAVSKKVVENHHGFITASSKLNEGSTFIIVLPLRQNLINNL